VGDPHLSNLTNCKYARCKAKRGVTWWGPILKGVWWSAPTLTRSVPVVLSRDTSPQLWIKLHRNQSNLLFTWPSIHLTGHVEVVENNPEIAPKRGVEICFKCWGACMVEMHCTEGSKTRKTGFCAPNSLGISGYSVPHKALNLNLSRLHRSSFPSRPGA
jgi:hypothetical protein